MAMVLSQTRLRLTLAKFFGRPAAIGTGSVTSVSQGTGIVNTPNPIVGIGSVALDVPVTVPHGGTGAITLTGYLKGTGVTPVTAQVTPIPVTDGGTGTTTAFTPGSVVFAGAAGAYSQDNANFFWHAATAHLGIGTTGPTEALDAGTGAVRAQKVYSTGGAGNFGVYAGAAQTADLTVSQALQSTWTLGEAASANDLKLAENANARVTFQAGGNVGVNTASPTRTLDLNGTQRWRGIAAPAVSELGSGTIYFDSGLNKYRVSMNGGAYVDLVGSAGLTGAGVAGHLPFWTSATNLSDAAKIYVDDANTRIGLNVPVPGYQLDMTGQINWQLGGAILLAGNPVFSANVTFGSGPVLIGGNQGPGIGDSTAVGYGSMGGGGGSGNTAVGKNTLLAILGVAQKNTAVGDSTLGSTTGDSNTALGSSSGTTNTTGSQNVFLGAQSDASAPNLTNAVAIGYQASVGANDSMVLGNGSMNVGVRTSTPALPLDVNGAFGTRHHDEIFVNGANQDFALTLTSFVRATGPSAPFSIGGFANGADGRRLTIRNTVAFQMTLNNLDGGSIAVNQILTPTGGNINCTVADLIYDNVLDNWVVLSYF